MFIPAVCSCFCATKSIMKFIRGSVQFTFLSGPVFSAAIGIVRWIVTRVVGDSVLLNNA